MIIVNFSDIAPVPPQTIRQDVLRNILKNCTKLYDEIDYNLMTESLVEWEVDLFMESDKVNDDWYVRALICICLRGLRGESRPNILNISE